MNRTTREESSESVELEAKRSRDLNEMFSLVYEHLRRIASSMKRREIRLTISSTALVDEAWLKLRNSPQLAATSLTHFKSIAAHAMRQVLVEEARRRTSRKRGGSGEALILPLEESTELASSVGLELLDLDLALEELKRMNPRHAELVEKRFFGGMSIQETAEEMQISESMVDRDWRVAKAWLATRIRPRKLG